MKEFALDIKTFFDIETNDTIFYLISLHGEIPASVAGKISMYNMMQKQE